MVPSDTQTNLTLEEIHSVEKKCQEFLSAKNNISFDDLVSFAKEVGFVGKQESTSHWVGRHPTHENSPPAYNKVNFQKKDGNKAKPYQVGQLVDFIRNAAPKKRK